MKKEDKALKGKLIAAVKKILKDNNAILTAKIEKIVKRSIKEIVKKSNYTIVVKTKPVIAKK